MFASNKKKKSKKKTHKRIGNKDLNQGEEGRRMWCEEEKRGIRWLFVDEPKREQARILL